MARAKNLLGLLSLTPMVVFAASSASEVPILGEEYVTDTDEYAGRIGQEAQDLFKTPLEEWNFYGSYDRGLKVYWRPVKDNKVCCPHSAFLSSKNQCSTLAQYACVTCYLLTSSMASEAMTSRKFRLKAH